MPRLVELSEVGHLGLGEVARPEAGPAVATVRVVVIDTLLLILGVAVLVVALARLLVGGERGVCADRNSLV
jgi:hypothetical protein